MLKTLNNLFYRRRIAAVYLNEHLEIVHCNDMANNVLQKRTSLLAVRSRLVCTDTNDEQALNLALTAAKDSAISDVVFIRNNEAKRPCRLDVMPVLDSFQGSGHPRPTVMVLIGQYSESKKLLIEKFRSYYKLTQAECQLVELLLENRTLKECAAIKPIKVSTARWTLGNIFTKTSTGSQKELINLALIFVE